jgi:eukaryotic-like serine/threonine-protein kinase
VETETTAPLTTSGRSPERRRSQAELRWRGLFGNLYPSYVRGLVYLRIGEFSLAGTEFQKLLDHPGIVGLNVIGALSRLQLARALRGSGDTAVALKSYEDFLAPWKNADPDIPIYLEAKAEYAGLLSVREGR